jgi:hypothetical protein
MNRQPPTRPEEAPGHYGAGYGEQVPDDAPPQPAPATDETTAGKTTPGETTPGETRPGDDGAPVVFTPEDVHVRPPDRPPTEHAPESEKAGLIFERS